MVTWYGELPPFAPQGAQIQGWGPGLPADKECGSKETALSLEYIGITTSFKNYPPRRPPRGTHIPAGAGGTRAGARAKSCMKLAKRASFPPDFEGTASEV